MAMIPSPWEGLLLALAIARTVHLLADDWLLDDARDWFTDGRDRLDRFVHCPWCLGVWGAWPWFAGWWWAPDWTMPLAWFAASTLAAPIMSRLLDD